MDNPAAPSALIAARFSRRTLFAVASIPIINKAIGTLAAKPVVSVSHGDDTIPPLSRSRYQRALSKFRYHNAEAFFCGLDRPVEINPSDQLYRAGIVCQLAISAHLLDVGFNDSWCARHIGLDVGKALKFAEATGFGPADLQIVQVCDVLSPYSRWRNPCGQSQCPDHAIVAQVPTAARQLLDMVRETTGHPRPRKKGMR